MSIQYRLYTTTSFFIEIHFYDDMFRIFIDPSSGHSSSGSSLFNDAFSASQTI
jgi:hypothetical protein